MNINDSNTYKIRILECEYTVVSDESYEHIMQSAKEVDELMRFIHSKSTSAVKSEKTAVLAALCIASKLLHAQKKLSEYEHSDKELQCLIDKELYHYSQQQNMPQ